MSELSPQHRKSVHPPACFRVCQSRLHRDAFFVCGPFLRLLVRVWTCRRYLTKARCLLYYYKHELHEQKMLQSFIQWHWGAVGGYIKAPYLPTPPVFNEKQDSPALTKPAICVSVLSLACMFVVFACVLLLCCIYACVKWHHVARASYLWSFMFDLIALRLSSISRGRPMIFWED